MFSRLKISSHDPTELVCPCSAREHLIAGTRLISWHCAFSDVEPDPGLLAECLGEGGLNLYCPQRRGIILNLVKFPCLIAGSKNALSPCIAGAPGQCRFLRERGRSARRSPSLALGAGAYGGDYFGHYDRGAGGRLLSRPARPLQVAVTSHYRGFT